MLYCLIVIALILLLISSQLSAAKDAALSVAVSLKDITELKESSQKLGKQLGEIYRAPEGIRHEIERSNGGPEEPDLDNL